MKPTIVVVAYNRAKSLLRLLKSIDKANYYNYKDIELVISIDRGENKEVLEIANSFLWNYGKKVVLYQENKLGLKKHILKCGKLAEKYGSIILLEDDLYVSTEFYDYACKILEFSKGKEYIAGISLYNHQINVLNNEPFSPIEDGYDNWYFQFASSWGQAWTAEQWSKFELWYYNQADKQLKANNFPDYISSWPETSWLKYFMKYIVEEDKYFVYPKISLTTNFSDKGTHVGNDNTDYQIPLYVKLNRNYNFSDIDQSMAVYDIFYENYKISEYLKFKKNELNIDLYGNKPLVNERFYLTRNILDYKIINSFGCCCRPHDFNIINGIEGEDFFLYDTTIRCSNNINKKENKFRKIRYNIKAKTKNQYIDLIKMLSYKFIKRLFK